MASVRKLYPKGHPKHDESPWVVEYTDAAGKRRRATPTSGLKKDADNLRRKIERELTDGTHVAKSETATVEEAIALWLHECEKRVEYKDMTGSTLGTYRGNAKRIVKVAGKIKLTEIEQATVQGVIDTLAKSFSPRTVKHSTMSMLQMLDFAVVEKWVKVNPIRLKRLRFPRSERAAKIPTHAELAHLISVSHTRKKNEQERTRLMRHAMFCLALFSTLRRGEVCGLRWTDVDLEKGVLRIQRSRSQVDGVKGPKTEAGKRAAPLPTIVVDALAALPQPRGEYIFTRRGGSLPNPGNMHLHWYYLAKKAGLADESGKPLFRFHDMRHAAASLLIAKGANPLHVQRAMGHASVRTTLDIYGHLFEGDDTIRETSEALSQGFIATQARHALSPPAQTVEA